MTTSFLIVRLTEFPAPVNSEQTTPILYVGLHIIQGLVDNMPKTLRTPTTYVACLVPRISLSWTGTLELFLWGATPPIDRAHKAAHSDPSCFVHRVFYAWLKCPVLFNQYISQCRGKNAQFHFFLSCRLFNNNRLLVLSNGRRRIRRP